MVAYGKGYHRAQILLDKEQHEALQQIAARERRSMSEVVREIVQAYIAKDERERRLERELAALDALDEIRKRVAERSGAYEGDLLAEVRAEREAQMEEMMRAKQPE
jgi:plasmid stability protein